MSDQKSIEVIAAYMLQIALYTNRAKKEKFEENPLLQDAISYCLAVIGHQKQKLSDKTFKKLPRKLQLNIMLISNFEFIPTSDCLWDYLFDSEAGLLNSMEELFSFYESEFKTKLPFDTNSKTVTKSLPISLDYIYPIHSKSSLWSVRKR